MIETDYEIQTLEQHENQNKEFNTYIESKFGPGKYPEEGQVDL